MSRTFLKAHKQKRNVALLQLATKQPSPLENQRTDRLSENVSGKKAVDMERGKNLDQVIHVDRRRLSQFYTISTDLETSARCLYVLMTRIAI